MKNIFVVNPAAGNKSCVTKVKEFVSDNGMDCEIYETRFPADASHFVWETCKNLTPDEKVRFVACGGDGTLNEVVNGAALCDNACVAVYPCGSGNDYIKYYGTGEMFCKAESLNNCQSLPVDLMRVTESENTDDARYSINVCNFGFDTAVVEVMNKVRRVKFVSGKTAYMIGVAAAVFTALKTKCRVYADGERIMGSGKDGEDMTLCTVANGCYIGGKYKCAPKSSNNDGLLEVCFVKPVSLFTLIRLIGVYANGKHLDDKRFEKYLVYRQAKNVRIEAYDGFKLCIDGELVDGKNFDIEVVPSGISFCVPRENATAAEMAKTK